MKSRLTFPHIHVIGNSSPKTAVSGDVSRRKLTALPPTDATHENWWLGQGSRVERRLPTFASSSLAENASFLCPYTMPEGA